MSLLLKQNGRFLKSTLSKEITGITLIILGLLHGLSLLSYHPQDTTVHVPGPATVSNWIGPAGALVAQISLDLLGLAIYIVVLTLVAVGLRCFWSGVLGLSWRATAGWMLLLLSTCCLLAKPSRLHSVLTYAPGGFVGQWLWDNCTHYLAVLGTQIAISATAVMGFLLLSNWSLSAGIRRLFESIKKGLEAILRMGPMSERLKRKMQARQKAVAQKQAETGKTAQTSTESNTLPQNDPENKTETEQNGTKATNNSDLKIVQRDTHQSARIVQQAERKQEPQTGPIEFALPPLSLLHFVDPQDVPVDEANMRKQARKLEKTFLDFGIEGNVNQIRPGPVVTMFEFIPSPGIKLSRISALSDDIAMAMQALHVRIVAPIPGKGAVGIEIPNEHREVVYLKEIVAHPTYNKQSHRLCMAIGKTVSGQPYFANLADMPHLLIAGTTGSGKSVAVNAMICSILYRATPQQVRFLMIDPKMLELGIYEGIPHLLLPPIIDSTKAARALQWAVKEMDRRYNLMNDMGVRGIESYNTQVSQLQKTAPDSHQNPTDHKTLPYIVVVVDEYADLVAVAGRDVETCVMRLAQKARACGIHVILATQRPSVDVITGVIKANLPVRIGFRLASVHDSKTIINTSGAEKLLGKGDMLILPPGRSELTRIHGAFLSDQELQKVVAFWQAQASPQYDETIVQETQEESDPKQEQLNCDSRYDEAVQIVMSTRKCSTSWLQRQLGVGYNRAAKLVEQLERKGVVGPILNAKGDREIFSQGDCS
ncbi:MAG: DNA translocase FtsK 4TM domain-containing protein [Myxococcota bacterium]